MPIKSLKSAGTKALGQGLGADGEPKDAEFNQTTLLLHADGSEGEGDTAILGDPDYKAFKDSTSTHDISVQGNAYGSNFSPYSRAEGYWSTTFNGNGGSYIIYQGYREYDQFNLDDRESWCVDFWVFVLDNSIAYRRIAEMYTNGGWWAIKFNSGGNGTICIGASSASNDGALSTGSAIPENRWVHVALTNDGDRLRWIVDGKLSAVSASGWTQPWSNNTSTTSHSQLQLSNYLMRNGYVLPGSLNNFRIVQGSVPSEFQTTSTTLNATIFSVPTAPTADPHTDGYLSVDFNGSNEYINLPSNSALTISTNDFTIEFWVYLRTKSDYTTFYDQGYTGGNALLMQSNNNASDIRVFTNGSVAFTSSSQIPLRTWTHVALVRISGVVTLYFNGSSVGTANKSTNFGQYEVQIGRGSTSHYLDGFLSNYRIVIGSGLYSSSFTPSDVPFTTTSQSATSSEVKLLACQSKRFVDNSSGGLYIKPRGIASEFHPFNDGYWSVEFANSNERLQVPHSSSYQLGTGQFTLELFVKFNSIGTNTSQGLIGNYGGWYFQYIAGELELALGASAVIERTWSPQQYRWYHIACTRDSNNDIRIFVDGTQIGSVQNSTANLTHGSNSLDIGNIGQYGRYFAGGKISNIRIIIGSALYTSNFSKPTSPLTTTSQGATASEVKLLMCQSNRFIENSSNNFSVSLTNDPNISDDIPFELLSRQTKILTCRSFTHQDIIPDRHHYNAGKGVSTSSPVPYITASNPFTYTPVDNIGSGYFDGTGDGLTTLTSSDFAFGTGNFTFEAWVYPTSAISSGTKVILDLRYSNNNQGDNLSGLVWTGSRLDNYSSTSFSSDADLARFFHEGTWNHICVQRIGNNLYHSVNGYISHYNPSFSRTLSGNGKVTLGGNEGLASSMFTGYIADVRVTKSAVYGLRNFNPPTSSMSSLTDTKFLACQYSGAVRNKGFLDESTYNTRITPSGNVTLGTFSPFSAEDGHWSVYFNGNYLNITDSADFTFGSSNFSIAVWVYRTDTNASTERGIANTGGTGYTAWLFTTKKFWASTTGNSWGIQVNYSQDVPINQWVYVQVNRVGNVYTAYHNGVSVGTTTVSGSLFNNNEVFQLGFRQGASSMIGYMSNFIMTNGSNLSSTNVPTEPFTADSNTKLLCLQSNRYIDNSNSGHTITPNNSASTLIKPFSPFKPSRSYSRDAVSGSVFMDGNGDKLTYGTHALKAIGSGDFTVELWWYPINVVGSYPAVFSMGVNGGYSHIINIGLNGNKTISGGIVSGYSSDFTTSDTYFDFAWNHLVLTRSGTGTNNCAFFLNGKRTNQWTDTGDIGTGATVLYLGSQWWDGNRFAGGYYSNVRVTKNVVYSVSNATLTVPSVPLQNTSDTLLLSTFKNGGIIDHRMSNNLETVGNTRIRTDIKKYGTGSIYFDGSDELNIDDTSSQTFYFGTGQFTIEAFIRVESNSSSSGQWFSNEGHGGWTTGGIAIWFQSTMSVYFWDYNSNSPLLSHNGSYNDGVMRHYAIVRGTSGACALFVNGTRVATGTHTGNVGRIGGMCIGNYKGQGRYLTGFIDEMRVTKGVARYDPSQTSVTVPTKAFANR